MGVIMEFVLIVLFWCLSFTFVAIGIFLLFCVLAWKKYETKLITPEFWDEWNERLKEAVEGEANDKETV